MDNHPATRVKRFGIFRPADPQGGAAADSYSDGGTDDWQGRTRQLQRFMNLRFQEQK